MTTPLHEGQFAQMPSSDTRNKEDQETQELARFYIADAATLACSAIAQNSSNSKLTTIQDTVPQPEVDGEWRVTVDGGAWAAAFAQFWEDSSDALEIEATVCRISEGGNDLASEKTSHETIPPKTGATAEMSRLLPVSIPSDELPRHDIEVMKGAQRIYLFAEQLMTKSYARWAFLSEEGDDLAAFLFCVREESRVYPRPMLARSLQNSPFNMTPDRIAELHRLATADPCNQDIRETRASNGDIYYYSTTYLSPRRAERMAERLSVFRIENP